MKVINQRRHSGKTLCVPTEFFLKPIGLTCLIDLRVFCGISLADDGDWHTRLILIDRQDDFDFAKISDHLLRNVTRSHCVKKSDWWVQDYFRFGSTADQWKAVRSNSGCIIWIFFPWICMAPRVVKSFQHPCHRLSSVPARAAGLLCSDGHWVFLVGSVTEAVDESIKQG